MNSFDYGKRIKKFRKIARLESKELAKLAKVDVTTIYKLERNEARPSVDSLERLCFAMGISLMDFFLEERDLKLDIPAHVKAILEDTDLLETFIECQHRPELVKLLKEASSVTQQTVLTTTVLLKALADMEGKDKIN